ncbi:MAG: DUF2017 family protein [Chthoniobacteraceae bacterium]
MEIRATDEGWVFEDMDPLIVELLRTLPACATPDDDAARKRIFSTPTNGDDAEADRDWRENVEPGMSELFKSHVDVVAADLGAIQEKEEAFTLGIPAEHGRAWIHTLNQARLALGARHGVDDDDTGGRRRRHSGAKAFAIMQIDFYGMLLGMLLSRTEL